MWTWVAGGVITCWIREITEGDITTEDFLWTMFLWPLFLAFFIYTKGRDAIRRFIR